MSDTVLPGAVLYLYFSALQGGPKSKFCVLACVQPKLRFLLISSERSKYKRDHPVLSKHQVLIDAANHSFLDYDSYIDCSDPYGMDETEFHTQTQRENLIVGELSNDVLGAVRKVIAESTVIPKKQISWMLGGLSDAARS